MNSFPNSGKSWVFNFCLHYPFSIIMIYYIGNDLSIVDDVEVCTLQDAFIYLKDKEIIGLDIETTKKYGGIYPQEGLDPYTSEIVMVQMGDLENQYIIDYRHTKTLGPLNKILESDQYVKVGHNIKFEYKHIFINEGIKIINMYDTMIVEQILFNGFMFKKYSLAALIKSYFEEEVDKSTRLNFLTIGSRPFTKTEIQYGADDVTYPLKIKKEQLARTRKYKLKPCIKLEMLFLPVLGDIELKGINFNKKKWLETYEVNKKNAEAARGILNDYVFTYLPKSEFIEKQLDLFDTTIKCNINWSSSHQVIKLFRHLKMCPQEVSKTTKKLSYTVNASVLKASLNTTNKGLTPDKKVLIAQYLEYKEEQQACTTFGEDFLKHINPITKRIHSNYRQILNTGRISSSGPNLQNIPASERFRKAFDAPERHKIINADYSGQEQIILANKSKAPNLLAFYEDGLADMHSYVASHIFGESMEDIIEAKQKPYGAQTAKDLNLLECRQVAKAAGFAINYGGTGYTISKNLGIPVEQGDEIYDKYFKAFPGLKSYFKKVQDESLKQGFIRIDRLTNRVSFFRKPTNNKEVGAVKRAALNFPIQGEAGSITKLAAIYFRKEIMTMNLEERAFITNLVHDEINVECDVRYTTVVAEVLEAAMFNAAKAWCKTIPLAASAKVVDYWTH